MKKIQFAPCENAEITVWVSSEMEKDFLECARIAADPGIEAKECEACSWLGKDIGGTCLCEMMEQRGLIK